MHSYIEIKGGKRMSKMPKATLSGSISDNFLKTFLYTYFLFI